MVGPGNGLGKSAGWCKSLILNDECQFTFNLLKTFSSDACNDHAPTLT